MSADPTKIVLYMQGTFDIPNPTNQQIDAMVAAAEDISNSGFGTVILGQWHVHMDGSIYYNDSPLDSVIQTLKVIPTALTQGSVEKVLIDFGPFGSDFRGMQKNLALFKKTMAGVQAVSAINGFDWDLEDSYQEFPDLLVDLTQWANGLGLMVTAAPYTANTFWTSVLKKTNPPGSSQGFAWWNLQLYGGADYGSWVGYLNGLVPNPQAFLVPGYNINGMAPADVQSSLNQLSGSYPSLDGGFIWRYEDIASSGCTTADYAQAIAAGLGGT